MKLKISEGRKRMSRYDQMSELESQGYDIIDSGYEDYHPYEEKWRRAGYDVKSFYQKSDTRGLKMWVMYGKKKEM